MKINWFTIRSAIIASIGGYAFGIDGGIIATTIGHASFLDYMFPPSGKNAPVLGAIVAIYSAGSCIGSLIVGPLADKISRRWSIAFSGIFATLAGILMCAAQNPAMMIVGRLFAGFASGINVSIIPVYIAEISVPATRGIMVGIQGTSIAIGYCLANWIGYAGEFAKGDAQWRIPLGVQCIGTLLIGIAPIFLPYTPRWLVQKERFEEAREVLSHLHSAETEEFVSGELRLIMNQIQLESEIKRTGFLNNLRDLCSVRYRRRFLTAVWIMVVTGNLSGVSVIQNYQTEFHNLVGYTGNAALLVTAVYGLMGVIGQIINVTLVADKRGRKSTMWMGSFVLVGCNVITMAMTATVGNSRAKGEVAIAFIFIYSACYAIFFNTTNYLIVSEIFPFHLRAVGFGVSNFIGNCVGIMLSEISPFAFDGIGWKYYIVFIVASIIGGTFYIFFLPETKGLNLEEIAAVFGDLVVTEQNEEKLKAEGKVDPMHIEDVQKTET